MFELRKYFKSFIYKVSPYSQAGQDLFAYEQFGFNGTYIEFGDSDPKKRNALKDRWQQYPERKNKIYWDDAISFNYRKGLLENDLNHSIDFLSCDIDPQENTFIALKKVLNDGVKPKLIAFETDYYREKIDYSTLAYNFLKSYGYKIGVKNVYSNLKKKKIFETWFVIESLDLKTIDYKDWVKKY